MIYIFLFFYFTSFCVFYFIIYCRKLQYIIENKFDQRDAPLDHVTFVLHFTNKKHTKIPCKTGDTILKNYIKNILKILYSYINLVTYVLSISS